MAEHDDIDRLFEYMRDLAKALESGNVVAVYREAEQVVSLVARAKQYGFRSREKEEY